MGLDAYLEENPSPGLCAVSSSSGHGEQDRESVLSVAWMQKSGIRERGSSDASSHDFVARLFFVILCTWPAEITDARLTCALPG